MSLQACMGLSCDVRKWMLRGLASRAKCHRHVVSGSLRVNDHPRAGLGDRLDGPSISG